MTDIETKRQQARERIKRFRERKKQAGMVEVRVLVPAGSEEAIKDLAAKLRGG